MINRCRKTVASVLTTLLLSASITLAQSVEVTWNLALDLTQEGNHEAAAIEYRRLALMEEDREKRAGYYWAAAYEYRLAAPLDALGQRLANNSELVAKMLDRAEDDSQTLTTESILLRAEAAIGSDKPEEAAFYLQSIIASGVGDAKAFASRRLARIMLSEKNISGAREALLASPYDNSTALAALDRYGRGRDKVPCLGGILGLIPGLGYAYSGEYANALRSLILNGLFIFGMVDTAGDEEWGAFAAITFFEITWYTGSIYGGIDAAHRCNLNRLNNCVDAINGNCDFYPDLKQIPIVSLKFQF